MEAAAARSALLISLAAAALLAPLSPSPRRQLSPHATAADATPLTPPPSPSSQQNAQEEPSPEPTASLATERQTKDEPEPFCVEEREVLRNSRTVAPPPPPFPGMRDEAASMLTEDEYFQLRNAIIEVYRNKDRAMRRNDELLPRPTRRSSKHQVTSNAPRVAARKRNLESGVAAAELWKSEDSHCSSCRASGSFWWSQRQSRSSGSDSWHAAWGSHSSWWNESSRLV